MYQPGPQDEIGAHQEGAGQLDRVKHCKQADAHGDADMAITNLRADDDILPAEPGVIQRNKGIGQHHKQAAEPADFGEAEDGVVGGGEPIHQVFNRKINTIGADGDKCQVYHDGPVDFPAFADVVLEHFKDVQDLPEQEQADQNNAVVAVEFIVVTQRP